MNDEKYICQCCGGRINRYNMTCEYCGTQYKEQYNDVIRIETFHNPIQTLGAEVIIDRYMIETMKEDVGEYVMREISRKISNALLGLTQYDCEYNPMTMRYHVRGRAKVVVPKDRGTDFNDWLK